MCRLCLPNGQTLLSNRLDGTAGPPRNVRGRALRNIVGVAHLFSPGRQTGAEKPSRDRKGASNDVQSGITRSLATLARCFTSAGHSLTLAARFRYPRYTGQDQQHEHHRFRLLSLCDADNRSCHTQHKVKVHGERLSVLHACSLLWALCFVRSVCRKRSSSRGGSPKLAPFPELLYTADTNQSGRYYCDGP